MRTLLRVAMYAVAFVAGVDAYLVGGSLAGQSGLPAGWAQVTAAILGTVVALIAATVPVAIYQRLMRGIVARRRAARVATPTEPVDLRPQAPAETPPSRPRSNQTFGVTSRENRSLQWPAAKQVVGAGPLVRR